MGHRLQLCSPKLIIDHVHAGLEKLCSYWVDPARLQCPDCAEADLLGNRFSLGKATAGRAGQLTCSSWGNRFGISPELSTLLRSSNMVSTTICVSVNKKVTLLPSTPVLIYSIWGTEQVDSKRVTMLSIVFYRYDVVFSSSDHGTEIIIERSVCVVHSTRA